MLDQLVESRNTGTESRRRNGFILTVGVFVFSIAVIGLLTSLFAQNLTVGGDGLELSTLIAPVPLPEEAPPPPDEPEPEKKQTKQDDPKVDVRKEIVANINESPTKPPKEIKTTRSDIPARRLGRTTVVGPSNSDGASSSSGPTRAVSGDGGGGIATAPRVAEPEPREAAPPPPPPPPPPKPTPPPVPQRISGGVVNGKAISLPVPPYPAAARAVRASGSVSVSVVISKDGSVMSANASGGHPLLRAAAESAARRARFRPTMLSGQPVEVSGVIVYNFKP